jgi:hypothetical protein
LQAPVRDVDTIQRHPRGDARPRLGLQVEVVLVQRLPARARRLEVDHRLHRVRRPPEDRGHHPVEPVVDHPLQRKLVPAVHLRHPRVPLERVAAAGLDADDVVGVPVARAQHHVVLAQLLDLRGTEQPTGQRVPVTLELGLERIAHPNLLGCF